MGTYESRPRMTSETASCLVWTALMKYSRSLIGGVLRVPRRKDLANDALPIGGKDRDESGIYIVVMSEQLLPARAVVGYPSESRSKRLDGVLVIAD
jgi:hypothetical protein